LFRVVDLTKLPVSFFSAR